MKIFTLNALRLTLYAIALNAIAAFAGAGTNAVWIAKGTTTNDWIAVKP